MNGCSISTSEPAPDEDDAASTFDAAKRGTCPAPQAAPAVPPGAKLNLYYGDLGFFSLDDAQKKIIHLQTTPSTEVVHTGTLAARVPLHMALITGPKVNGNFTSLATSTNEQVMVQDTGRDKDCPSVDANGTPIAGISHWYTAFRRAGGRIARKLNKTTFERLVDASPITINAKTGAAERSYESVTKVFKDSIDAGFAYIAIDELRGGKFPEPKWENGQVYSVAFAQVMAQLKGVYAHRVILYVNSYNMPGGFEPVSDVLNACAKNCRVLASEVYRMSNYILNPAPNHAGTCTRAGDCYKSLTDEMVNVAPGLKNRTIAILGVSDFYFARQQLARLPGGKTQLVKNADGEPITRRDEYCTPGAALSAAYERLAADRLVAGIGFYNLFAVGDWSVLDHNDDGTENHKATRPALIPDRAVQAKFARCVAKLNPTLK
jgi:hypothetical protein